jgi:hypothetical protein
MPDEQSVQNPTPEPCPECGDPEHDGPCRNSVIDWWVSLSPAEQDRIIREELARDAR